jgi:hypothetical protein
MDWGDVATGTDFAVGKDLLIVGRPANYSGVIAWHRNCGLDQAHPCSSVHDR